MKMSDQRINKVKNKRKEKGALRNISNFILQVIIYSFVIGMALLCIFPFLYVLMKSFSLHLSDLNNISMNTLRFWINHYTGLFQYDEFKRALQISITRTALGTVLMVIASSFAGYLLSKKEMWGRRFWYCFFILTLFIDSGLISWYVNMKMLGLTDSFMGYILPSIVAPINIIMVKNYLKSIPPELEESAYIDGAGYITRFRKIIIPLCKPILITVTLFSALWHWNSFIDSFVLMRLNQNLFTLQFFTYRHLQGSNAAFMTSMQLSSSQGMLNDSNILIAPGIRYASAMIITIPVFLLFFLLQKYFFQGVIYGKIKD